MKMVGMTVVLLLAMASSVFAMEEEQKASNANKTLYITAKMSVDALQKKAEKGDMGSALAVYDFYESVKDPGYKITFGASKKALEGAGLIDDSGKVHQATREAFKQYTSK